MRKVIEMLTRINGGSLIEHQSNQNTIKSLLCEDAILCIDERDGKHYFFSEYHIDGKINNLSEIEMKTIRNNEVFADNYPSPSDSYLILFWKVNSINEDVFSKVIEIEENEYFYKKYVFYYTEKEMVAFEEWLSNQSDVDIPMILREIAQEGENLSEKFLFIIRLFTKIPFWRFEFKKDELDDFEDLVENKVMSMRGDTKGEARELLDFITEMDVNMDISAEDLANAIYKKYVTE